MNYKDYSNRQPRINTFFKKAIVSEKIPHSFLIEINNSNVIDVIKSAMKQILCTNGVEYCDQCSYCSRINGLKYSDLIFVDGDKGTIKKDDILNIINRFSYTALDYSGYKFYIINKIENSNKQALNSLLKFLEEPPKKTIAFLTTSNTSMVLPTIVSRCVHLKPQPSSIDEKVGEVVKMGASKEDAQKVCMYVDSIQECYNLIESGTFAKVDALFKSIAAESNPSSRLVKITNCLSLSNDENKLLIKMLLKLFKEEKNIKVVQYLLEIESNYIWNIDVKNWLAGMELWK